MKKILLVICALAVGISAVHAQQQLNVAIQGSVGELSGAFENGSMVTVLAMYSDSALMSDHLISEMLVALMSMQHARGITVVNRVQLNTFAAQLNFDTAGLIDDALAGSIGSQMYVRYVITGAFEPSGDFFRLRLQVIDIQTSALRSTQTYVQNDGLVASLMGIEYSPAQIARTRTRREARERERLPPLQDPTRFWSLGINFGSTFVEPLMIGTLQATIAPWSNWFFRVGFDYGIWTTAGWNEDMGGRFDFSMSPFVHFVHFRPFGARGGWYAGIGGSVTRAQYGTVFWGSSSEFRHTVLRTIVAVDLTMGINLGNWFDISYTMRTPFSSVIHKVSVGYTFRIQQRSR